MTSTELAKQLRIGNYVQSNPLSIPRLQISSDGIMTVSGYGISVLESDTNNKMNIKPIPLDEQWLYKLGFERSERRTDWDFKLPISAITLYCRFHTEWYFQLEDIYLGSCNMQHVHSLQNFCSVFGKELEVKQWQQ